MRKLTQKDKRRLKRFREAVRLIQNGREIIWRFRKDYPKLNSLVSEHEFHAVSAIWSVCSSIENGKSK
jgi:hypothetical protein